MTKYNSSLDDLPDTTLVVDRRSDLLEIRDPRYNLVIWTRREYTDITDYFENLHAPQHSAEAPFYLTLGESVEFREKVRKLDRHVGRDKFLYQHKRLNAIMRRLQDGNRSILTITDFGKNGYNFHQDNGFSLNWTILGPAGIWVENQHVTEADARNYLAPRDKSVIRQFPDHSVSIYKGRLVGRDFSPSGLPPLVHSRPDRGLVRRAHHQIYL